MIMTTIKENLASIKQRIDAAAHKNQRATDEITLVAVSKTKPITLIDDAINAGQRVFGENYVQEGVDKIAHFNATEIGHELVWHFIGPLQSNKTKLVAENFAWMHTVSREKIARRLSEQRPATMPALNILIQINIDNEETKSGITPAELLPLADKIATLPRLCLRGIMVIPAPQTDPQKQLAVFKEVQALFHDLKAHYPQVDTISMGMTDDMESAIAAGSTMVRIGTAIFGARAKQE